MAGFTAEWKHYQERWPHREDNTERRKLGPTIERELELGCERIQTAESRITTALRDIEASEPDRALAGLDFRLKSRDRIAEKARQNLASKPDRTPEAALALIPDAVRYTFCYGSHEYALGVRNDLDRLKAAGFEKVRVKNLWGESEYRGINSQWRETQTGQRFEVQFHTAHSFEAKQVTHGAYERLREGDLADDEELVLEDFQRKVTATIPVPPGALDIADNS
jgi:hypothetical protein